MMNRCLAQLRRVVAYLFIAAVLGACSGCEREFPTFPMTPFSRRVSLFNLPQVPLILVGQALENCHPAAPPAYSGLDGRPYQLWKIRVKVEHVIQGEIDPKNLDIFYFVDWGSGSSAWTRLVDMHEGSSEVFFLQKDGDKWRTICDGLRSCVLWVRTGTHSQYKIDPNLPIQDIFVNLMLSRGDHTSDRQMIDAIYHPETRWGTAPVINRLQQLAHEDPSPQVRAVALEMFQMFQKRYGKGTREAPQDLL